MDISERIALLCAAADKKVAEYWQQGNFTHALPPRHEATNISDKWCRVVTVEERNGEWKEASVYCFVALVDNFTKTLGQVKKGDIHKAASYKVPAKHARGNVFDDDFAKYLTAFGIVYLR